MRTNYVLIDYESAQPSDLSLIDAEHFRVLVFVGAEQPEVPIEFALAMQRMGGRAEYVRVPEGGRPVLDLHLAFHLGRLAGRDRGGFFHVVSRDARIDPLIEHLKGRRVFACRSPAVAEIPILKTAHALPEADRAKLVIAELRRLGAARPRSVKSLLDTVRTLFPNRLADGELARVLDELVARGAIVVADGRIRYVLGANKDSARIAEARRSSQSAEPSDPGQAGEARDLAERVSAAP